MTNGSSPRVSENQSMTGQRNENSVLFSLSNLQALATGTSSAPTSARPATGMAQGEGSGLIDIRALATATQSVADKPNGSAKESIDDLLSVGSAGSTFMAATLAAPVAAEKPDHSKVLMFGMGAAILALGGVVGWLALREPAAPASAAMTATPAAAAAALPTPTAGETAAAQAAQPAQAEPAQDTVGEAARAAEDEARADRGDAHSTERKGTRKPDSAKAAEKSSEPSKPAAADAPAPAPKASKDSSIDDLLNSALGGSKSPDKPKAATTEALPQTPNKEEVGSVLKGLAPRVQSCGNGQTGVAITKITVAGPTGRPSNVEVSGQFAGTPVGACVVREVGKAKFPKFQQATLNITYPFKI